MLIFKTSKRPLGSTISLSSLKVRDLFFERKCWNSNNWVIWQRVERFGRTVPMEANGKIDLGIFKNKTLHFQMIENTYLHILYNILLKHACLALLIGV